MTETNFVGRVGIVTGAGGGLGRAYALELARRGARVVVNDLGGSGAGKGASTSMADAVVTEIRDAGGEAIACHASVATRAGGAAVVEAAMDEWGRLDICINNAGFLRNAAFEDLADEQIDAIIDVHLKGAFYVSQPAFRIMKRQNYGRLLFTGSASGMFGHAWQANYAAAKTGVFGLSNVIAIESADYGIASNVILPTAITRLVDEMQDGFLRIPSVAANIGSTEWTPQERAVIAFNVPLALYLVSEASTATHGTFIANAGHYARVGICVAEGWTAPAGAIPPSVEDLASHFDRVCAMETFAEPLTLYDEITHATRAGRRQGVLSDAPVR